MNLSECKLNKKYRVVEVNGDLKFKRRLLEFGFVDTEVQVLHTSSLKGVFLVQLRGYVLAIRRAQAQAILVREEVK